jgi:SAM-dependent methyltransferase
LIQKRLRNLVQRILPVKTRRKIIRYTRWPPVGWVRFGSLRRLKPISTAWGSERGMPIDRYYIERFLTQHASDIRGHVLEIKEDIYASRFGGNKVTRVDVIHPVKGNPHATIVADLTSADHVPSNTFDCIIFTQTLQLIYETRAAVTTLYRILKPGGILLTTVSGISKISRDDMDRWGYYWQFTTKSARKLFEHVFPSENIQVDSHGNVLAAVAFLHGAASDDLRRKELDYVDQDYQLLICIRAVKPGQAR